MASSDRSPFRRPAPSAATLALAALLVGCGGTVEDSGASPAPATVPEYEAPEAERVFTPEEAVSAIEETLAAGFPAPHGVRGALDSYFSHGDETCPGAEVGTDQVLMGTQALIGCTSAEGWRYDGIGGYLREREETPHGEAIGLSILAELLMLGPEGSVFEAGGEWVHHVEPTGAYTWSWSGELDGTWTDNRAEAAWLLADLSAWVRYEGTTSWPEGAERPEGTVSLEGGVRIGAVALHFHEFALGGEACPGLPQGTISVFDPGGRWYAVEYTEACKPCGTVRYDGEAIETTACLDTLGWASQVAEAMLR